MGRRSRYSAASADDEPASPYRKSGFDLFRLHCANLGGAACRRTTCGRRRHRPRRNRRGWKRLLAWQIARHERGALRLAIVPPLAGQPLAQDIRPSSSRMAFGAFVRLRRHQLSAARICALARLRMWMSSWGLTRGYASPREGPSAASSDHAGTELWPRVASSRFRHLPRRFHHLPVPALLRTHLPATPHQVRCGHAQLFLVRFSYGDCQPARQSEFRDRFHTFVEGHLNSSWQS